MRRLVRRFGAVLAVIAATVMAVGVPSASATHRAAVDLRVLNYNIHFAQGTDGTIDLGRIASVIRAQHPDIVTLQEVHRFSARSPNVDQAAELGRTLDMNVVFGDNNTDPDWQGEHGNVVLSRFPVIERVNYHLPSPSNRVTRGMVGAKLDTPAGSVRVFSTHLINGRSQSSVDWRQRQASVVLEKIRSFQFPTLLTGDFNAAPSGRVVGWVTDYGFTDTGALTADEPTSPSYDPQRRIDYVFASPAFEVLGGDVPRAQASDHFPVVADLRLSG